MFYWLNEFNGIEEGGPFESVEAAQNDAANVYAKIQDGMAIHILIRDLDGELVSEGHIKDGKWGEGVHPKFRGSAQYPDA